MLFIFLFHLQKPSTSLKVRFIQFCQVAINSPCQQRERPFERRRAVGVAGQILVLFLVHCGVCVQLCV